MKLRILAALAGAASILAACCGSNDLIKTKVPARPAGQESMVGYAAPAIDTVRVGFVGTGMRGSSAVKRFTTLPWCKVAAIAEVDSVNLDKALGRLHEAKPECDPAIYFGEVAYKDLCASDDVDLVYICTDWNHHVPVALEALACGKHVAIEVPSAMSLQDCWDLVNASEKMRRHCIILENCCYDFFELASIELARQGLLGDIVHAEGAYIHELGEYWDRYWDTWRLKYNMTHKGDVYPTHGLGPVAQALGINRGDRFTSLVAMQTASFNGKKFAEQLYGEPCPDFANGDLTCTLLGTEKGRTVLIEHDVMNPRPYNRMFQLVGTEGFVNKYPAQQVFLNQWLSDSLELGHKVKGHAEYPKQVVDTLFARYRHPVLNDELEAAARADGGHGGMDFIMDYRMLYCLHYGLPVDMDVYDLATWCCLAELGSISMDNGCRAVEVPDFTRGEWQKRDGMTYAFSDGSFR